MKINMILPALGHSGGVQMATDYLNYFVEQGNDVVCYVPFTGAYYGWKKILFPKAIYRLLKSKDLQGKWIKNKFVIKFIPYINNLWIRDADITIATSWLTSYWLYRLNSLKGKKVYFIQDYETWGDNKENQIVRKSYRLPFDLRVTVSTQLHDKLLKKDSSNSQIICNGIKKEYIKKTITDKTFEKMTIGLPYREIRGESNDIKNSRFAIKALEDYIVNNRVCLKTYGFNKPRKWNNNISFLENPSREQLFNWYDNIDIFYVPSLYEGWGLPAMEAMARGCVVIASDTGCIREFGKHLINCYKISDMTSRKELFKGLDMLIQSDELRKRISKNALKTVKNYTFELEAKRFLRLLDKLKNNSGD